MNSNLLLSKTTPGVENSKFIVGTNSWTMFLLKKCIAFQVPVQFK